MKKAVLAAVLGLASAGCGQTNEAKEAVSRKMRDPSSVQFRELRTVKQADGTRAVCGEYNAKNAFGAYVGFEGFVFHEGRVYLQKASVDLSDARDIELTTEGLRAHNDLCLLKGQTIEEVQAETARIIERTEALGKAAN